MYLRQHLDESTEYVGLGLGSGPTISLDLETEKLPFDDNHFDTVLCLDVLEHVENPHAVFDELCRVSAKYVVLSFPNAWASLYATLRFGEYKPGTPLKFYGLPTEVPEDRHKWFFNNTEARAFLDSRSKSNGMASVQLDETGVPREGRRLRGQLRRLGYWLLFDRNINRADMYSLTLWAVIEKDS
jgi:SAM-dependent methyltransferase